MGQNAPLHWLTDANEGTRRKYQPVCRAEIASGKAIFGKIESAHHRRKRALKTNAVILPQARRVCVASCGV
eukprot:1195082-Prorocentrum_minimum.AAC.12